MSADSSAHRVVLFTFIQSHIANKAEETLQNLIENSPYWTRVRLAIYALNQTGYSRMIKLFGVNSGKVNLSNEYEFERRYKDRTFSAVVYPNGTIEAKVDGVEVKGVDACNTLDKLGVYFKVKSSSQTRRLLNWIIQDNDYSWRISNYQPIAQTTVKPPQKKLDEDEEFPSKPGKDGNTNLTNTEREVIGQGRIGQDKFRSDLINYWKSCAITGCKIIEILKASHIKPWRDSTNIERLDLYNGILLIPNLDSAFDSGLISFEDNGKIMISNRLSKAEAAMLGHSSSDEAFTS